MRIKSGKLKSAGKNTGESEIIVSLKKENAYLKSILNSFPLGIYVKNVKPGKYVFRNDKFREWDSRKGNELKSKEGKIKSRKGIAAAKKIQDDKVLKSGKPSEITDNIRFKDSAGERWFRTLKIPLQVMSRKPNYLIGITEDITEKIRLKDKLTENTKEFEFIFKESLAVLIIIDTKTKKILRANRFFTKITGLKAGEIKNKTLNELGIKTDSETHGKLNGYLKGGKKINNERVKIKFRNREFTGQISAEEMNFKGKTSLLVIFNDMTGTVNAATELRGKENLLKKISDTVNGIIYIFDTGRRKNIFINNKIKEILGYSKNEFKDIVNPLPVYLIHSADTKKYSREITEKLKSIRGNEMLVSRFRIKIKGSKEYKRMLEHLSVLERNDAGKAQKIMGILYDISRFENTEKELINLQEKLDYAKVLVNFGCWEYDMVNKKLETSEEMNKILEIPARSKIKNKKEFLNLIPPEDRAITESIKKNIQEGRTAEITHRIKLLSGKEKYIYSKIKPIINESGKAVKISGISCDVTGKASSDIKLRHLTDELFKSKKHNGRYVSIITENLRVPLTGLLGIASVLDNEFGVLSRDDIYKYVTKINASLKTVYNLIENMLQWSKISSGRLLFNPEKIDLHDISESVKNDLKPESDSKNITVINEIKPGNFAYGDENMLRLVFQNLLSNSIKFSNESDSIVLSAEEKGNYYEISVSDTGVGMKPEVQKNLFNIYEPYTTLGTKNEKGAGLGLILCKEFIKMHNSTLGVNSEEGIGTAFNFKIKKF